MPTPPALCVPAPAGTGPAPGFDYVTIPVEHRGWLQSATSNIRALAYRSARDMIRVGQLLADARGRLKRRTFRKWITAELPWSRSHAYRLIQVGEVFGPLLLTDGAQRIEPTALYMLARPEVPPEARRYAVELSADREVTAADAREILDAHRNTPDPTRDEVRAHERTMKPIRDQEAKSNKARPLPAEAQRTVEAWAAIVSLAELSRVVHISPLSDEADDEAPLYSVTVYAEGDRPRNVVRRTLEDAILAAAGREPEKVCPRCQQTKPVGLFSLNRRLEDGANRHCKACERARLSGFKRERRERRRAEREAASKPVPNDDPGRHAAGG